MLRYKINRKLAQLVERLPYTQNVIGSNPVLPTKTIGMEVDSMVYINKNDVDLSKGSVTFRLTEGGKQVSPNATKRKLYTDFSELDEWFKSAPC